MKRLTKVFKGGQKGFTLIELLIVIVILGVLAAAIIPNLSRFTTSGKLGAANAELASIRTGVAAYMSEHDGNPPLVAAEPITGGASVVAPYVSATLLGTYYINNTTGEVLAVDTTPAGNTVYPLSSTVNATISGAKFVAP